MQFVTILFLSRQGRSQIAKRAARDGEPHDPKLMNEGSNLALRALGRATLYTFGFFGASIGFLCYKFDIKNLRDLRLQMQR